MSLPKADKNFGQHFLINQNVIAKITTPPASFDQVIEVGPGPAVLTKLLKEHDLYLVEKDKRFREILLEQVKDDHLFMEDALDFDYQKIPGKNIWLVSNLPYNVSAPLTIKFLQLEKITSMTLMYQKEVAAKILCHKKDMNSLGALCNNYFGLKSLVKVSPGNFQPPPKVQSEVLFFERRINPEVSLKSFSKFEKFLRNIFKEKRKTLNNNLKTLYSADLIDKKLESLAINPKVRAEALEHSDITNLFKAFNQDSLQVE